MWSPAVLSRFKSGLHIAEERFSYLNTTIIHTATMGKFPQVYIIISLYSNLCFCLRGCPPKALKIKAPISGWTTLIRQDTLNGQRELNHWKFIYIRYNGYFPFKHELLRMKKKSPWFFFFAFSIFFLLVCLFISLFVYVLVHMLVYLFICLFICLFVCLFVCAYVPIFVN